MYDLPVYNAPRAWTNEQRICNTWLGLVVTTEITFADNNDRTRWANYNGAMNEKWNQRNIIGAVRFSIDERREYRHDDTRVLSYVTRVRVSSRRRLSPRSIESLPSVYSSMILGCGASVTFVPKYHFHLFLSKDLLPLSFFSLIKRLGTTRLTTTKVQSSATKLPLSRSLLRYPSFSSAIVSSQSRFFLPFSLPNRSSGTFKKFAFICLPCKGASIKKYLARPREERKSSLLSFSLSRRITKSPSVFRTYKHWRIDGSKYNPRFSKTTKVESFHASRPSFLL